MDELVAATNSLALVRHKAFDLSWLWARSPGRGTRPPTTLERCMDFMLWRKLELDSPVLHLPSTQVAGAVDLWFDGLPEYARVHAVVVGTHEDGRCLWFGVDGSRVTEGVSVARLDLSDVQPLYLEKIGIAMIDARVKRPTLLAEYPGTLREVCFTQPGHPGRDVLAVHVAMSTFQPVRTWGKRWDAKTRRPRHEPGRPHLRVV